MTSVENYPQALYREAQLALRGAIGTRELDVLLAMKDAKDLLTLVKTKAEEFGIQVTGLGIRDIVLPGEMKDLLNKVTEAKKAAEANLITRREEVAAMRSQANTARIFETIFATLTSSLIYQLMLYSYRLLLKNLEDC